MMGALVVAWWLVVWRLWWWWWWFCFVAKVEVRVVVRVVKGPCKGVEKLRNGAQPTRTLQIIWPFKPRFGVGVRLLDVPGSLSLNIEES